ncbi:MAG TPA: branched-chain amino acid ABC transporter permease [Halobacteriales archaeon]|nr:branched-chain amino acid ABC transporter permease [Halobacteriales archaeon]
MVSTELLVQQVINGISIGSWLFLVAVGLSLIFGVLGVLNFAHGALFMIGAYVTIVVIGAVDSFWLGIVLAALVVGTVGMIIEMGFIRRLYGRAEEELDQLLMTFAFVLIITDSIRAIFGSGSVVTNPPNVLQGGIGLVGGYGIGTYRAFLILASVAVMGAILLALRSTNLGRLVRATSSDRDMALLLGIDVPRLYTLVFFIGAAMAGVGGALITPIQSLTPELGNQVIINAFVVVVIGGLGSFTGAFVGAYLIGIMIAVGSIYAAGAGQLFPFIALIAILLIRPEGLFGGIDA